VWFKQTNDGLTACVRPAHQLAGNYVGDETFSAGRTYYESAAMTQADTPGNKSNRSQAIGPRRQTIEAFQEADEMAEEFRLRERLDQTSEGSRLLMIGAEIARLSPTRFLT